MESNVSFIIVINIIFIIIISEYNVHLKHVSIWRQFHEIFEKQVPTKITITCINNAVEFIAS